jgi:hypothetical protein
MPEPDSLFFTFVPFFYPDFSERGVTAPETSAVGL